MKPLHALSVHREMELVGVMVIVHGLMNNVFHKVRLSEILPILVRWIPPLPQNIFVAVKGHLRSTEATFSGFVNAQ